MASSDDERDMDNGVYGGSEMDDESDDDTMRFVQGDLSSETGSDDDDSDIMDGDSDDDDDNDGSVSEMGYTENMLFDWEVMESSDDEGGESSISSDVDESTEPSSEDDENGERRVSRRNRTTGQSNAVGIDQGTKSTKTFTLFPLLPAELRLRIWEMHCPALFEKARVFEMNLADCRSYFTLTAGELLPRQTRPLRRFMRISHETRARGLQAVPDELPMEPMERRKGDEAHRYILRFNGKSDILFFRSFLLLHLFNGALSATPRHRTPIFVDCVRNIALQSWRSGTLDWSSAIMTPKDARELFDAPLEHEEVIDAEESSPVYIRTFGDAIMRAFPKLENFYSAEHGSIRRADCWVAGTNKSEYHLRIYEYNSYRARERVDVYYFWREPSKQTNTKSTRLLEESAAPRETDNEVEKTSTTVLAARHPTHGDRYVEFSRLLCFFQEEGRDCLTEITWRCPDGEWPTLENGEPEEDDVYIFDWTISEDDYESSGIDDESIEVNEDEDEDENNLDPHISDNSETEEAQHLEAAFSSPEPESSEVGRTSNNKRGTKRRIVSDSDDEDVEDVEGGAIDISDTKTSKRRRRHVVLSDESDGEDERIQSQTKGISEVRGEGAGDDEEEEEEVLGERRLTFVESLQLHRAQNPISGESEDEEDNGDNEEEGEEEGY